MFHEGHWQQQHVQLGQLGLRQQVVPQLHQAVQVEVPAEAFIDVLHQLVAISDVPPGQLVAQ